MIVPSGNQQQTNGPWTEQCSFGQNQLPQHCPDSQLAQSAAFQWGAIADLSGHAMAGPLKVCAVEELGTA